MSSPVRRKNPDWLWAADFSGGGMEVATTFNPYSGEIRGVSQGGGEYAAPFAANRPESLAWQQWFGGSRAATWNGGACWTADHFWFIVQPTTADPTIGPALPGGLYRTDRHLTTKPELIRTAAEISTIQAYRFTEHLRVFPKQGVAIIWESIRVGAPNNQGPVLVKINLTGPPNRIQLDSPGRNFIVRGWDADHENGHLFMTRSTQERNVLVDVDLSINGDAGSVMFEMFRDPDSASLEEDVGIFYRPCFDYLGQRVLLPLTINNRNNGLPVTHQIREYAVRYDGTGEYPGQVAFSRPAPFVVFQDPDEPDAPPQLIFIEQPRAVVTNARDRKIYEIRHQLIAGQGALSDEAFARAKSESGLWQYDYTALPMPSQGGLRNLANPQRLCDDPLRAQYGTSPLNDNQRIVWGPGWREAWEL